MEGMRLVGDKDVQDAVPEGSAPVERGLTRGVKTDASRAVGELKYLVGCLGLAITTGPNIAQHLLMLPQNTPSSATTIIGVSMAANAVTLHMLQKAKEGKK
jgi:hypothetical protein